MIECNEQNALNIAKVAANVEIRVKFPFLDSRMLREIINAGIDIGWQAHIQFLRLKEKYQTEGINESDSKGNDDVLR